MNLMKLLYDYQCKILGNCVLIEYDLFFNNIQDDCCIFAIDENEELEELNKVVLRLKERDEKSKIYVCTYPIEITDEKMSVYGDSLWIDTSINVNELEEFFANCRIIEPSYITLLSDDETMDRIIELAVSSDGTVQDYKSFIDKRKLDRIKSLYWD